MMKFFLTLLSLLMVGLPAAVDAQATDVASFITTALGKCGNAETGAYNQICMQAEIEMNPFDLSSQYLGGIVASCQDDSYEKIALCVEGTLIAITVTDALSMCGNPATGVYNSMCLQGQLGSQSILIDRNELDSLFSACAVNRSFGDCALNHFLSDGSADSGIDDLIDVSEDEEDAATNGDMDPLPPREDDPEDAPEDVPEDSATNGDTGPLPPVLHDSDANAANSMSTGLLLVDALVGLSFAGFMLLT